MGSTAVAARNGFGREQDGAARREPAGPGNDKGTPGVRPQVRSVRLGPVRVADATGLEMPARRPPPAVSGDDPELYRLLLVLGHRPGPQRRGPGAGLHPGDLVLSEASPPLDDWDVPDRRTEGRLCGAAPGSIAEGVILLFPRELLPLPDSSVRRLTARRLPGDGGVGALLAGLLEQTLEQAARLMPSDAGRLASAIVDLVTAVLDRELRTGAEATPPGERAELFLRVRSFILDHLGEPWLSPTAIAAAHGISVRSLHRLCEEHGTRVGELIRTERLAHCRRDLSDPLLGDQPVHLIAARWGFTDASHFSRAFRAVYGLPPGEHRRLALRVHRPSAPRTVHRATTSSTTTDERHAHGTDRQSPGAVDQ